MPVFVAVPEFFRFLRGGLLALRALVMPTSMVAAGFWLVGGLCFPGVFGKTPGEVDV